MNAPINRTPDWIEFQLEQPIPNIPDVIEVLEGNNYARAWWVIQELTRIFGPAGWSFQIRKLELVEKRGPFQAKGKKGPYEAVEVLYRCEGALIVRIGDQLIEKCDVGFGLLQGPSFVASKTTENAGKSAATDCLKRCARLFGRRLGNGLYGDPTGWTTQPTVEDLETIGEYHPKAPTQQERAEEKAEERAVREEQKAPPKPSGPATHRSEHPATPPNGSRVDHGPAKAQAKRDQLIASCRVYLSRYRHLGLDIPPSPGGKKSAQLSDEELAAYSETLRKGLEPSPKSSLNREAAYKRIIELCGELQMEPKDGYKQLSDDDLIAYGRELLEEVQRITQDMM